jgi:succinyl-CoA:acetate CoA-transferase
VAGDDVAGGERGRMADHGRIRSAALAAKVVPADVAAAMIRPGDTVGMSGFTGAGYPKAVPEALAKLIAEANGAGTPFRINVWTGASTAPELDGALAAADGIELRLPYQSDPVSRAKINAGEMDYVDVHLSHVAQMAWEGFLGHLDVALVEVSGITA